MAVYFSNVPVDYSSAFSDAVYTIEGTGKGEAVDVDILKEGKPVPIGVKRMKGGGAVDVNIAAYLRRNISPKPFDMTRLGLYTDTGRTVAMKVRTEGVTSATTIYTGAVRELSPFEVLTELPAKRTIWWDESDEISILLPDMVIVGIVKVVMGGKELEIMSSPLSVKKGIVTMVIGMEELESEIKEYGGDPKNVSEFRVQIVTAQQEIVANVEYSISQRAEGAVRLCWYNELGGIDYHTFENVISEKVEVTKSTITTHQGYQGVGIGKSTYTELTTGFMPYMWLRGLRSILSAPYVWRMSGDGFIPQYVQTRTTEFNAVSLSAMSLSIRDKKPANCQNT